MRFVPRDSGAQCPRNRLEDGFNLVMGVLTVNQIDVQVAAQVLREGEPEVADEFRRKVTHFLSPEFGPEVQEEPSGEIDDCAGQGLVHRDVGRTVPRDERFVAERLSKGLSQRDSHVLDGVVLVHVQVPLAPDVQIEPAVTREQGEHVIEEANAGRDFVRPGSVQIEADANLGLGRLSGDIRVSRA